MSSEILYTRFARYYDRIYSKLGYKQDVDLIEWLITKHKRSEGRELLDVGCGTGSHAAFLAGNYSVLGVDTSDDMLRIARKKVNGAMFQSADMKRLDLGQRFDIIICMFGTINYNIDHEELRRCLEIFRDHLVRGGVLIFDMGFHKQMWIEGHVTIDTVVEEDLQLARISQFRSRDDIARFKMIFLAKENGDIDFEIDEHELGLFEIPKVRQLMEGIGFETYVYAGHTRTFWDPTSKERPYFCGIWK